MELCTRQAHTIPRWATPDAIFPFTHPRPWEVERKVMIGWKPEENFHYDHIEYNLSIAWQRSFHAMRWFAHEDVVNLTKGCSYLTTCSSRDNADCLVFLPSPISKLPRRHSNCSLKLLLKCPTTADNAILLMLWIGFEHAANSWICISTGCCNFAGKTMY